MREQQDLPANPADSSTSPTMGSAETISKGKRNVLKAGWVVPVIAVMSLPKNSYAVVAS